MESGGWLPEAEERVGLEERVESEGVGSEEDALGSVTEVDERGTRIAGSSTERGSAA